MQGAGPPTYGLGGNAVLCWRASTRQIAVAICKGLALQLTVSEVTRFCVVGELASRLIGISLLVSIPSHCIAPEGNCTINMICPASLIDFPLVCANAAAERDARRRRHRQPAVYLRRGGTAIRT